MRSAYSAAFARNCSGVNMAKPFEHLRDASFGEWRMIADEDSTWRRQERITSPARLFDAGSPDKHRHQLDKGVLILIGALSERARPYHFRESNSASQRARDDS